MGKKREEREKKNQPRAGSDCNLDGEFRAPVQSFRDLSLETTKSILLNSRYIQALLALTAIGFILRFYNLGYNSLWLDEASTYTFARMSLPGIWEATTGGEFNPPLFYWIEHLMLTFGTSEVTLRFIPALLGVLTIPLVYLIGKEFTDRNVGIIAAAAFTFSPFLIFYSQEARAYSVMLFFVALALWVFLRALKTDDLVEWALFGLFSAFALWSHFYGFVIIASLILYALYVRAGTILADLRNLKPLAVAVAVFGLFSLPLLLIALQLFTKRSDIGVTFGFQGIELIIATFRQISGFSDIAMVIFILLFLVGVFQAFRMDRDKGVFLVLLTVLTFVISYLLSYKIPMQPRYLIFLSIVFFIGVALAYKPVYYLISNRGVVYGFMALMVLLSAPLLVGYYSGYSKEDWRGFSKELSAMTKPGDLVVVLPAYVSQPLNYYYSNTTDTTFQYGAYTAEELDRIALKKVNSTIYYVITGDILSANPNGDALAWLQQNARPRIQGREIIVYTSG